MEKRKNHHSIHGFPSVTYTTKIEPYLEINLHSLKIYKLLLCKGRDFIGDTLQKGFNLKKPCIQD
jgi:hypothetical protein